jgi:ribosomal protein S12 methylthiotransferase
LPGQIPRQTKENGREQLMLVQQQIAFEKNKARQGQLIECLINENQSGRKAIGRFYGQAPHIDSICLVDNCSDPPGSFVEAMVTGFKDYDLLVKKI